MERLLKSAGKSALMLAGISYGLFRGLQAFNGAAGQASRVRDIEARLEDIEQAVTRISDPTQPAGRAERSGYVSREDLAEAIDRATARIDRQLEARFEKQSRAVGALRAMVGQTDLLLQRVLDGIENAETAQQEEEVRT